MATAKPGKKHMKIKKMFIIQKYQARRLNMTIVLSFLMQILT